MKKYFIIICSLIFCTVTSQVIINSNTKQTISNVTIISKTGQILLVSDKEGKVSNRLVANEFKISDSDTIEFIHPNFEIKKITWKVFKNEPILLLDPIQDIEEVFLTAKNEDYLVLRSYFTSYQIIDNEPQSFSDGIIEYYISLSKNKLIDFNIVEARVFKNIPFINEFYKKLGNTTLSIGSQIQPFNFYEEILLNRWSDFTFTQTDEIELKNNIIGNIEKTDENSNVFIEYYTPSRIKEQSLLGMSSKIENYNVSEKFASKTPSIKYLKNISKYYKSFITQKKINFKYELVQNAQVLEREFLTKDQFGKLKSTFNHSERTNYINNYWEQNGLIEIPFSVKKLLIDKFSLIK